MKIAFLGLGEMGSRMAKKLIEAGHELFIYNRTAEKAADLVKLGAKLNASPKAAAEKAEIVISMVTDNEASRTVWLDAENGAIRGLKKDAIVIESSTLTPDWMKDLAAEIFKAKAEFLEAPVIGSRPQAEAGQLVYLIGGDSQTAEKVREILSVMGGKKFHTGEIGTATLMKLAVNALFGIQVAALSEILGLLNKAEIKTTDALKILNELPMTSPAAKRIGELITKQEFNPNFPISLVEKDFRYVVETAAKIQFDSPISKTVHKIFESGKAKQGNLDISGIFKMYQTEISQ